MAQLTRNRRQLKRNTIKDSVIKQSQRIELKSENGDSVCCDKAEETHSLIEKEQTIKTHGCNLEYETDEHQDDEPRQQRRKKLIAFIGNLPYHMTEERLR